MQNILVTGANRGIGLEFVKQYLADGERVWACYRSDKEELAALSSPNLSLVQWDVTTTIVPSAINALPDSINLLINNAGIYGLSGSGQALSDISDQHMSEVFSVNAVSPLLAVQNLLPQLTAGKATIANMSSKMGSSSDNTSGGVYAYRASKAALCSISKSMAVDLAQDDIKVITLHPGWVKTDMTNHTGLVDASTSVSGLRTVIANVDQFGSGAFVAYDGQIVPY